jgi:hypothetical protein
MLRQPLQGWIALNLSDEVSTGSGSDLVRLVTGSTLLAAETRSLPLLVLTPLCVRKLGHYAGLVILDCVCNPGLKQPWAETHEPLRGWGKTLHFG